VPVRFPHMPFGPFELRPLLRARLEPGERLVGWGTAHDQETLSTKLLDAGFTLVPLLGHAAVALRRSWRGVRFRLLIITDRRLLVLASTRAVITETARLEADVPLAELDVRCAAGPDALASVVRSRPGAAPGRAPMIRFRLRGASGWDVDLDLPQTSGEPLRRLRSALVVLALDSAAHA
jgi:hypothetical protein